MAFGRDDLQLLRTGMIVEVAKTPEVIREAQALRHQVFCLERKLFTAAPSALLDQDPFDDAAQHVIIRRHSDREVVATSRVVASRRGARGPALPMQSYCCPSLFRDLPMHTVGEISRFAISKQARGADGISGPALRLLLLRGILDASQAMGLTHWCALMEPSLVRLLAATGVQFAALGPLVEAYGLRQPCVAKIDAAVARGRHSHPHFYEAVAAGRHARAA